ncbi:MAG TPA: glycosyltransferase family 2 protein [Caulobacteraceae bacterium]|nr:glycosyltransferase family 2 protein [Caulobacteraceae bacterium]
MAQELETEQRGSGAAGRLPAVAQSARDHAFVVLAYRESPFLEGCLACLRAQTLQSQVLITTSTPSKFIAGVAEAYGAPVIVNPRRDGIACDWNFGLRATAARFVTLAHQDDTYAPDFLAQTLEQFERRDAVLCFTGYQEVDDEGRPKSSRISRAKHLIELITLGRRHVVRGFALRTFLSFGNPLPCSSVTFDTSRLGDFNFTPHYAANLDWEAWWRLRERGETFLRAPTRLVGRRHNDLTATSRLILDGTRRREDLEMFRHAWPRLIADVIAAAYRFGY